MPAFEALSQTLILPDLWQQEALRGLREGRDVVVHAPTGAGKTYIFELFHPHLRGQAVFTVPTRALANDKLAEWQKRGWDVGIATGDVALRLDARVVVATLETQKGRLLEGKGPALLVIDEYQMIADPGRGVNYELAVALAPPDTQLLLLSGSVANPQDVVDWLRRIGRDAVLVSHRERPVPLEEVNLGSLASSAAHWWPRMMTEALRAGLGPVLLFAPRRNAAEELAQRLAEMLPPDRPLALTLEQRQLAGDRLSRLLQARVAFHHSGLSYAQRAGLIEPLAKAGELRAVVATMGLAAGINFSMRSVAITGTAYMAGNFERQVQPDELLQMFGRAGRRGLDETGYALVSSQPPRLHDARPRHLRRAQQIDWPTLIAVMHSAAEAGAEPFAAAMEVNQRLFAVQKIPLGVEHSFRTGPMPCGLRVDMERARFARRGVVEILNSRGEWETKPPRTTEVPLGRALVLARSKSSGAASNGMPVAPRAGESVPVEEFSMPGSAEEPVWPAIVGEACSIGDSPSSNGKAHWRPALSYASSLQGLGTGNLVKLPGEGRRAWYGREVVLGTRRGSGAMALAPWLKRSLGKPWVDSGSFEAEVLARLPEITGGSRLVNLFPRGEQLVAHLSYEDRPVQAWIDSYGEALLDPLERRELPRPCRAGAGGMQTSGAIGAPSQPLPRLRGRHSCPQLPWCLGVEIANSAAYAWRRLGLIEADGRPTRRGIIFSYFQHGEGLAVAAALEDETYAIDALVFDLANLRAGPRFAGEDSPYSGRLALVCQKAFDRAEYPGYLEMGVPHDYGAGAGDAIREMIVHGVPRQKLLTESLRIGDIERALVEWRSLLRHIANAPDYDWDRWRRLREAARARALE